MSNFTNLEGMIGWNETQNASLSNTKGYKASLTWLDNLTPPASLSSYFVVTFYNLLFTYTLFPLILLLIVCLHYVLSHTSCKYATVFTYLHHNISYKQIWFVLVTTFALLHILLIPLILLFNAVVLPLTVTFCLIQYKNTTLIQNGLNCLSCCVKFTFGAFGHVYESSNLIIFHVWFVFASGILFLVTIGFYWVGIGIDFLIVIGNVVIGIHYFIYAILGVMVLDIGIKRTCKQRIISVFMWITTVAFLSLGLLYGIIVYTVLSYFFSLIALLSLTVGWNFITMIKLCIIVRAKYNHYMNNNIANHVSNSVSPPVVSSITNVNVNVGGTNYNANANAHASANHTNYNNHNNNNHDNETTQPAPETQTQPLQQETTQSHPPLGGGGGGRGIIQGLISRVKQEKKKQVQLELQVSNESKNKKNYGVSKPDDKKEDKKEKKKSKQFEKPWIPMVVTYFARNNYELETKILIPLVLIDLISKYVSLKKPKNITFYKSGIGTQEILKIAESMNIDEFDGYIKYTETNSKHHLKILCFGDCHISSSSDLCFNNYTKSAIFCSTSPPGLPFPVSKDDADKYSYFINYPDLNKNWYNSNLAHFEIVVYGTLIVDSFATICTDYAASQYDFSSSWRPGNNSSNTRIKNVIFPQKRQGGLLTIKCNNLKLDKYSSIHSCGNEIGGIININVLNNMEIGYGVKIYANAYHKIKSFDRKGGKININVGNQLILFKGSEIDVAGSKYLDLKNFPCTGGEINLRYKSIFKIDDLNNNSINIDNIDMGIIIDDIGDDNHDNDELKVNSNINTGMKIKDMTLTPIELFSKFPYMACGLTGVITINDIERYTIMPRRLIDFANYEYLQIDDYNQYFFDQTMKKSQRSVLKRLVPKIVSNFMKNGMKNSICKKMILASGMSNFHKKKGQKIKKTKYNSGKKFLNVIKKAILKYVKFREPYDVRIDSKGLGDDKNLSKLRSFGFSDMDGYREYDKSKNSFKFHIYGECGISSLSINSKLPEKKYLYVYKPLKTRSRSKSKSKPNSKSNARSRSSSRSTSSRPGSRSPSRSPRAANININTANGQGKVKVQTKPNTKEKGKEKLLTKSKDKNKPQRQTKRKTKTKANDDKQNSSSVSGKSKNSSKRNQSKKIIKVEMDAKESETKDDIGDDIKDDVKKERQEEKKHKFYETFAGEVKFLVYGDLRLYSKSYISTNEPFLKSMRFSDNIIVRQKKEGGIINIECYNLILEQRARIHACGNESGGKITIHCINDLIMEKNSKMCARAYHSTQPFPRKGGTIIITVGNTIKFGDNSCIDVCGDSEKDIKLPCDYGKIIINCESLKRSTHIKSHIKCGNKGIFKLNGKKVTSVLL